VLRRKLRDAGLELERVEYILTTPVTLALVRLSWRLDDLPAALLPLKGLGYLLLLTVGRLASGVAEAAWPRRDSGLTILAAGRK
jgi:hypothetical protein